MNESLLCPGGHHCPVASFQPVPCPQGTYCPIGVAFPLTCMPGFYCPRTGSEQSLCPEGFYCPGGASGPTLCPEGHYCHHQSSAPSVCPCGFFCSNSSVAPTSCPAGNYCPESSDHSTSCEAGSSCPEDGLCRPQQCHEGTYQAEAGQTECALCSPGSESGPGSTSCLSAYTLPSRRNLPDTKVQIPSSEALIQGNGSMEPVLAGHNTKTGAGATVQAIWSFVLLIIVGGIVRRLSVPLTVCASNVGQTRDVYESELQHQEHLDLIQVAEGEWNVQHFPDAAVSQLHSCRCGPTRG